MATLVSLAHALEKEVAERLGCPLVAIYVNPATVTMVKPNDQNPKEECVVHFVNGESLAVVENFGEAAAKLSYPRGANQAFFRDTWFVVRDTVQEEAKRAEILDGLLRLFKQSGMDPQDVFGVHEEIDRAAKNLIPTTYEAAQLLAEKYGRKCKPQK